MTASRSRLVFFSVLSALALTAAPLAALDSGDPAWFADIALDGHLPRKWAGVIGRLHMALVHFPIGMLVAAGMVQLFAPNREPRPGNSILVCLGLGAAAAVLAAWTGWVHHEIEPKPRMAMEVTWHRWWGVGVLFSSVFAFLFAIWARKGGGPTVRRLYVILSVCAVMGVLITGHLGGQLVHGKDYLTRPLDWEESDSGTETVGEESGTEVEPGDLEGEPEIDPGPQAPEAGDTPGDQEQPDQPESTEEPETSQGDPAPEADLDATLLAAARKVIQDNCVECHNPDAFDGGFEMQTDRGLLEVPEMLSRADPEKSLVLARVMLPLSDGDHMPPDKLLSEKELLSLTQWIQLGSPGLESGD